MEEGEEFHDLMILIHGSVKVSAISSNGKNLILCFYVSRGILGDMEFLSESRHIQNQVRAISEVDIVTIPFQENHAYLESNAAFIRTLAKDTAKKLIESSHDYADSFLYTAEQRLAKYIVASSVHNRFSEVMTDVSSSTGMSYRHMYRILEKFCENGYLSKKPFGYEIIDEKGFKALYEEK